MPESKLWPLNKEDYLLLEGVHYFTGFLKSFHAVKKDEKAIGYINEIEKIFKKMPMYQPGFSGELSFTLRDEAITGKSIEKKLVCCKDWSVDLYGDQLEICSFTHQTHIYHWDDEFIPGLSFHLQLGKQQPSWYKDFYREWSEEVKNPMQFYEDRFNIEIDIGFNGNDRSFYL